MPEPSSGVENVAFAEFPVPGAVKMPQHKYLSLREKLLGKAIGSLTAGEPAANNVERALRRPETMQEPAQVFVANSLAAQDGRCKLTHGSRKL